MGTIEERKQFFANRENVNVISMKGKPIKLANFSEEDKRKVMDRLAEKDKVMAQGRKGILPGIKIDGKQLTRENIKDFEIDKMGESVPEKSVQSETRYSKEDLEKLTFKKLKVIGNKLGTTDRSKTRLIKEILKLQ